MFKQFRQEKKKNNRTNLILIGGVDQEYKLNDKGKRVATKKLVRKGQKHIFRECDVVLRTNHSQLKGYTLEVEKPWFNDEARGLVLRGDDIDLPMMLSLITNTDIERWEK